MKTFTTLSAFAALAAALPRGHRHVEGGPASFSLQPSGPMIPTSSFTGFPTRSGFPLPTGSGYPFPIGSGYPFPTEKAFAFKSGEFGYHRHHHHHGTGLSSGFGAVPTGFVPSGSAPFPTDAPFLSGRDAQFGSDAASFTEPLESGSAFSFPTAAPSISFPASGFGGESGFAAPTGFGGEGSFTGLGGESGFAKPTGFGGDQGGESGGAKPTGFGGGSFSLSLPTKSDSGFALPTGFFDKLEHHHHDHYHGTGSGFALPTGGFSGFPLPTGSFTGLPSGSLALPKPTETGNF